MNILCTCEKHEWKKYLYVLITLFLVALVRLQDNAIRMEKLNVY
jgi:hypothetical protein